MNNTIDEVIRRRFILGKQGLWPGRRWADKEGTASALHAAEALQIDPVSIIASSPDIALWGRVKDYKPAYLQELLYTDRRFFDYGGGLMVYPISELPYQRLFMERYKSEKRWHEFAEANPELLERMRQELRERGPLRNRDIQGKATDNYRGSKDTSVALYYLWLTGELMTHSRQGKERVYDFLEHVAPKDYQWAAAEDDAIDYFVRKLISERGLVTERDFRGILKYASGCSVKAPEAKSKLMDLLDNNELRAVQLDHPKQTLYLLANDWPHIESLSNGEVPPSWQPIEQSEETVKFLSPLEYVSARGRAKRIFGFDYIWELYKPASKRKYGPYTMPILYGDNLVARVDMKIERESSTVVFNGFWLEDWFVADESFTLAFAQGLLSFVRFLNADQVDVSCLQRDMRLQITASLRNEGVGIAA